MKPALRALVLGLFLGASIASGAEPTETHLTARITLKKGQQWNVSLLGRFVADRILMKKIGETGTIDLPISEIGRIDFAPKFKAAEALDAYNEEHYAELAPRLEAALEPYQAFIMDAPSNLDVLHEAAMKSWYWSGNVSNAFAASGRILEKTTAGDLHTEALTIRILALVQGGKIVEAARASEDLPPPLPPRARSPSALYALASLQMAQDQLPEAQESLARLISFHSRDVEWMPPALLLSAEGYARAGQIEVAEQVIEELLLNYPATHWVDLAKTLDVRALRPLTDHAPGS